MLVSPVRLVDRPPNPFGILVFDRLELDDFRFCVDAFRLLGAGDDLCLRFPFVGDESRDRTGDDGREFGREDGLEEGRDLESYGVTKVAGCDRLKLGVVGLERMLGDLFIEGRLVALLGELGPTLVFEVVRLKDEPESFPNLKLGLEIDRRSGLTLPPRLEP